MEASAVEDPVISSASNGPSFFSDSAILSASDGPAISYTCNSITTVSTAKKTMQEERRAISENARDQLKAAMAEEETSCIEKEEKNLVNSLKVLEKRPPRSEFYFFQLFQLMLVLCNISFLFSDFRD